MKVTCGGCSRVWGGIRAAHCSRCHLTFSSANAFDIHQVWTKKPPKCNDPAACGMVYDKDRDLYRFMNPGEEKDANDLRTVQGQEPRRMQGRKLV